MNRFALCLCLMVLNCAAREIHVDARSTASPPDGSPSAPFRTLAEALGRAVPGDTVLVHAGTYRESVRVPSGTAEKPVCLRAVAKERVIITGAAPVPDWQKVSDNVHAASLGFRPERLLVDFQPQPLAREPNEGWWTAQAVDHLTIHDAGHGERFPAKAEGGQVYIWTQHGNTFFTAPLAALDRERSRFTLRSPSKWMRLSAGDRYYFENAQDLIDAPGEWTVNEQGDRFQIRFFPDNLDVLKRVEAPRETRRVLLISGATNVQIEGLEIVASAKNGIEINKSENVTVSGCIVHSHAGTGIAMRDCRNVIVRRNLSWNNYCGITLHTVRGAVIEENDVGYNGMDGLIVSWNSEDITVRRNYLHHHVLWGHPDNLQVYRGVKKLRLIDNLLLAGGQAIMMEETSEGVLEGNMIIGAGAYAVIFGHQNAENYRIHNNTIAFSGYGCLNLTARNYDVRENVFVTGHEGRVYGVRGIAGYTAERNLFFKTADAVGESVLVSDQSWNNSVEQFRRATGQDQHSLYADPGFRNAPQSYAVLDSSRLPECTRDTWFVRKGLGSIQAGDMVEVDFDGQPRTVTAAEGSRITVSPGLAAKPLKGLLLCNWGQRTNLVLDLRLGEESPGRRLSASGGPVGSPLDIAAYQRGDFDGDGQRDLPPLPVELTPKR